MSRHSIHSSWKRELGGLLRWYANLDGAGDADDVNREIDALYVESGCDAAKTRDALLRSVAERVGSERRPDDDDWVRVRVAVETNDARRLPRSANGRGALLPVTKRPGEGPARRSETWNVVTVPSWAVGRSYFLEIANNSPLDLSCEVVVDGTHAIARNAPVPAFRRGATINPDDRRYFEMHKWTFRPAERVSLSTTMTANANANSNAKEESSARTTQQRRGPNAGQRYNGTRPNYENGRVDLADYPDPTSYGWTFTGSVQNSRVEFFEKRLNNGGTVKLDLYYTTATVKTVLDHPTTGRNQLFRKCRASPEVYKAILLNPRYHTGLGYRRRAEGDNDLAAETETETATRGGAGNDETMTATNDDADDVDMEDGDARYYAKVDGYDFEEEGHRGRARAMPALESSAAFAAWEEANRRDWACLRARFYVSSKRRIRRDVGGGGRQRRPPPAEREPLPAPVPVVDVRASADATVSTHFRSTGPSTVAGRRRSDVRMERVPGLNDDPAWGTGPVFEYKLYYRRETEDDDEEGEEMDDDDDGDNDSTPEVQQRVPPLGAYRVDRWRQVESWHGAHRCADAEVADQQCAAAEEGILRTARTTDEVDRYLLAYWKWHESHQWTTTTTT